MCMSAPRVRRRWRRRQCLGETAEESSLRGARGRSQAVGRWIQVRVLGPGRWPWVCGCLPWLRRSEIELGGCCARREQLGPGCAASGRGARRGRVLATLGVGVGGQPSGVVPNAKRCVGEGCRRRAGSSEEAVTHVAGRLLRRNQTCARLSVVGEAAKGSRRVKLSSTRGQTRTDMQMHPGRLCNRRAHAREAHCK
jgi:hypothetical protein